MLLSSMSCGADRAEALLHYNLMFFIFLFFLPPLIVVVIITQLSL